MPRVWVTSDLHLGHSRILQFSPGRDGDNVEEHDNILYVKWCSVVNKRDTVWVLGDVAFTTEKLKWFGTWPGNKILVRGNHDKLNEGLYRQIFSNIHGLTVKWGHWFSHAPIHPDELRGRRNIHGHIHTNPIMIKGHVLDSRYIPVCIEQTEGYPVDLKRLTDTGLYV